MFKIHHKDEWAYPAQLPDDGVCLSNHEFTQKAALELCRELNKPLLKQKTLLSIMAKRKKICTDDQVIEKLKSRIEHWTEGRNVMKYRVDNKTVLMLKKNRWRKDLQMWLSNSIRHKEHQINDNNIVKPRLTKKE